MRALLFLGIFSVLTINSQVTAQTVKKSINIDIISNQQLKDLKENFGRNKTLIDKFESQTLVALSYYPELRDVKIKFKYKKKISPLMTRPTIWSALFKKPHKRQYFIIISNNSNENLDPVLFDKMPVDAQIGVLGHELSHVSAFLNTSSWGMLKIAIGNLSPRYLDKLEYQTDQMTIDHGLGYQLLAWSEFVRNTFSIRYWNESSGFKEEDIDHSRIKERYMHPPTIIHIIEKHPLYQTNENYYE